jgi:hypothetical protein
MRIAGRAQSWPPGKGTPPSCAAGDNKLLYAYRVKFERYKGLKLANGAAFGKNQAKLVIV